jgi:hypothetical protein
MKKTTTETFNLLCQVYGEYVVSTPTLFEWHKKFPDGRENVENKLPAHMVAQT